jgi:DNA-binding MarR family transcriptional regulator
MDTHQTEACNEFMRVFAAAKAAMIEIAEAHNLTLQQVNALHILYKNGSLPMNAVATHMHCDPSNITGIIDRLVQLGYVERREAAEDRRTKLLFLTTKAHEVMQHVTAELPIKLGFSTLEARDCKALRRYLHELG